MPLDLMAHAHRRLNALTGEWVLVSPDRTTRPWQGHVDNPATVSVPAHDPHCYMCPGNSRASGARNPHYDSVFVFDNDFPALKPARDTETASAVAEHASHALVTAEPESGICRVVCFSPRHNLTLSQMSREDIRSVIDVWATERLALAAAEDIRYVQIFENRGALMGASNPHPHGQIWASSSVPTEILKELERQHAHLAGFGHDLLGSYLDLEIADGARVVCDNDAFVVVVPFWAVWPFETMILPRRRVSTVDEFSSAERDALADILKGVLRRGDNLFETSLPYSMGFHESPSDGEPHPEWRWHAHIYPPLLRSANVRKFMVGYELLASPQRDTLPEEAAARLRAAQE